MSREAVPVRSRVRVDDTENVAGPSSVGDGVAGVGDGGSVAGGSVGGDDGVDIGGDDGHGTPVSSDNEELEETTDFVGFSVCASAKQSLR